MANLAADKYILGAFPDGYVMWEHVRGAWVLPSDARTPVDPRKLSLGHDGIAYEEAAVPADDEDDTNEFLMVDRPDAADHARNVKFEVNPGNDANRRNTPARESASAPPAPALAGNRTLLKLRTDQHADLLPLDQQPLFSKRRDDLYLYGYKNNKRYAAPNEFFPHLLWLATAQVTTDGKAAFPCTCHHCDPKLDKERQAKKIDRIDLAYKKWKEHTEKLKDVR